MSQSESAKNCHYYPTVNDHFQDLIFLLSHRHGQTGLNLTGVAPLLAEVEGGLTSRAERGLALP